MLIQNRFEPIDIVDQTIFLFAALNGYLDNIPVNFVSIFEKELYSFLKNSIFFMCLQTSLREELDVELLDWILTTFKEFFFKAYEVGVRIRANTK